MLEWLRENGTSLLLSVVLSLAIWIVAVRQQDPIEQREYSNELSVVIRNLDSSLVTSGEFEREVAVSFRAPRSTFSNLDPEDIIVVADMGGLTSGTHRVPLEVELTEDVRALNAEADPEAITVTLEAEREREVPVQVTVEGDPALGYAARDPVVEPQAIVLVGPESVVDRVSEVSVVVDVSDARENVQVERQVSVLDSEGQAVTGLALRAEEVAVTVPVEHLPDFKEVAVIVSHEGTAPAFGFYVKNIEVTPITVTVQGNAEVIGEMPGFVRTAPVDLTGMQDSFVREVGLQLPEGVRAINSALVEVEVEIDAFRGSASVRRPLEVVGLTEGLEATISPDVVDMILSGSQTVLDQISQNDVQVVLDLRNLIPGTYQVQPEVVALPDGITSESMLPATIEVQIALPSASDS